MTPAITSGVPTFRQLALALPLVFIAHVLEEMPGFVAWFNSLVTPDITQQLFLSVNVTAFIITLIVSVLAATSREPITGLVALAWVGFLMLANGILHLAGTLVHARYCPGVVSGTLLYLPLSFLFLRAASREFGFSGWVTAGVALLGGIPMYVHGYLIVFRGSRLF